MTDDAPQNAPSDDPSDDDGRPGDRLAKVIARAGLASRRDAEAMIEALRVTVNGRTVSTPACNVVPGDRVAVDGVALPAPEGARLWLYHKPAGLVTSERDEKDRETVFDAVRDRLGRVLSVGRLDLTSEGLLLLTNDGDLKRRLELPETGWLRRYRVRVNGRPDEAALQPLRDGIEIDGERFQGMQVTLDRQQGANAWLTMGLREGRNREVRRAAESVGLYVNRLIRVSYGPFQLGTLAPGEIEEVKPRTLREQLGALFDGTLAEGRREAEAMPARKPRSSGDRLVDHGRGKPGAAPAPASGDPARKPRRPDAAADRAARPARPQTARPPVTRNDGAAVGGRKPFERPGKAPYGAAKPGARPARAADAGDRPAWPDKKVGPRPDRKADRPGPRGAAPDRRETGGDKPFRDGPRPPRTGPGGAKPPRDGARPYAAGSKPGARPPRDDARPARPGAAAGKPFRDGPRPGPAGGKPVGAQRDAARPPRSGPGQPPRDGARPYSAASKPGARPPRDDTRPARPGTKPGAPRGDRDARDDAPRFSKTEKKAAMRADSSVSLRKGGQRGRGVVKPKAGGTPGKTFVRPPRKPDGGGSEGGGSKD